ncbi:MAG: hypothetical protein U1E29_04955 [Coriobacteriia bacterium]|nr:hypothetical protein [Coriobacteriia bacterium]
MSPNHSSEANNWGGRIGPVKDLLHRIDELAAHGAPIPKKLDAVRAAWDAVGLDLDSARVRLAEAIADGRVDDVPELLMMVAVAQGGNVTEVRDAIANRVRAALVSIWEREGAKPAYKKIAADFDAAAAKLTECAKLVDVRTTSDALVRDRASKRETEAWLSAREYTAELDRLLPVLAYAAEMLPIPTVKRMTSGEDSKPVDWLLTLACDPGDAHRRRVWEAWQTKDAGGRWGGLLALGVKLRAHPDPSNFEIYERPIPIEVHQERGGIGIRQYRVDPEDALYNERLAAKGENDA